MCEYGTDSVSPPLKDLLLTCREHSKPFGGRASHVSYLRLRRQVLLNHSGMHHPKVMARVHSCVSKILKNVQCTRVAAVEE